MQSHAEQLFAISLSLYVRSAMTKYIIFSYLIGKTTLKNLSKLYISKKDAHSVSENMLVSTDVRLKNYVIPMAMDTGCNLKHYFRILLITSNSGYGQNY